MIKVLIERVIAEGLEKPYEEVARKVLAAAIPALSPANRFVTWSNPTIASLP